MYEEPRTHLFSHLISSLVEIKVYEELNGIGMMLNAFNTKTGWSGDIRQLGDTIQFEGYNAVIVGDEIKVRLTDVSRDFGNGSKLKEVDIMGGIELADKITTEISRSLACGLIRDNVKVWGFFALHVMKTTFNDDAIEILAYYVCQRDKEGKEDA